MDTNLESILAVLFLNFTYEMCTDNLRIKNFIDSQVVVEFSKSTSLENHCVYDVVQLQIMTCTCDESFLIMQFPLPM